MFEHHTWQWLSKAKRSWVWHHGATSQGCSGWFSPLPVAQEGKETPPTMQRGLRTGSTGMQGDHAALPEGDLSVSQPCLPHLSLYRPDPFPLLLSRSVFKTILSGNYAKCRLQVIEQISNPHPLPNSYCVARWSFLFLFWTSAYFWGSFELCEVKMDLSLSLVIISPSSPPPPGLQ